MRIKLDENVTVAARQVLGQFGHDAHSVHDEDLAGATDVELLGVVLSVLRRLLADHDLDDLGGCLVVVSDTQVRLRRP